MTHEELIEKVAKNIGSWDQVDYESDLDYYKGMAKEAVSTILTALQEPTEEMTNAWWNADDGFEKGWTAMLNASPLAGEKRGAE